MPSALQQIFRPNPLAFPGGNPGIDISHPAAATLRFACVATASNFLRIAPTITTPTLTATAPTFRIDGGLGPVGVFTGAQNTNAVAFAGNPTATDSVATIAAIFRFATNSGTACPIATSNTTAAYAINISTTPNIQSICPGTGGGTFTTLTPTAGEPYFVAISAITGNEIAVMKNLRTGQIFTGSATGGWSAAAQNGTVNIGCMSAYGQSFWGSIAAASWSNTFMPLSQLVQWANDPWSLWYPRSLIFPGFTSPPPVILLQGNMSLIMM